MSELEPTFLISPFDAGERVGVVVGRERGDELAREYGGPCDVVLVAVPEGQGEVVETWLRLAFGIESAPSVTKQP